MGTTNELVTKFIWDSTSGDRGVDLTHRSLISLNNEFNKLGVNPTFGNKFSAQFTTLNNSVNQFDNNLKKLNETELTGGDLKSFSNELQKQAQTHKAIEQAKRATIQTSIEEVKLERQKITLQRESLALETSKNRVSTGPDNLMKAAQTDIRRYQQENLRAEKEITRQIEREAKSQADAKIREGKRAANESLKILKESSRANINGTASDVLGSLGVPLTLGAGIGLGIAGIKSATEAAFDAERANRQLSASATQAGLSYQFLAQKSKEFADEGGLSITAANKTEGLIAKLARSSGRPQDLDLLETRLLDTASARGIQVSQLETIVNAIISGSSDEPLNAIGLQDPGKLAKDYADSVGKSVDALTKQEQVLSRLNPFLQQAETLTGANAERMASLSGQSETVAANLENLTVKIGSGITNTLEFRDALKLTNDILKSFSTNVSDVQDKLGKGLTPKQIAEEEANKKGNRILDAIKTGYTAPLAALVYPFDAITDGIETANNRFLETINGAKKRRIDALTDMIQGEQNLLQKQNEAAKKQDSFLTLQTFEDQEKARLEDEKKKLDTRRKEFDKRFSNVSGLSDLNQNRTLLGELGNNRDLFTAEEFAKRIHDVQQKINDDLDKSKKKVEELGKSYKSIFDNLSGKVNSNNPFVSLFFDARSELDKLKDSIKGLPEDLQKAAIGAQQAIGKNRLFETRLDNNLSVLDLRQRAIDLRSSDTLVSKQQFEEIVKNSISRGNFFPNFGGTYGSDLANRNGGFDKLTDGQKRSIYEVSLLSNVSGKTRDSLITALSNERVANPNENLSLNERLQKQLSIINSGVTNDAERAIADKRLLGLSSGLDASQIKADLREQLAQANEREAVRRENYEKELLRVQKDDLEVNKKILANQEKLLKIAEKDGLDGLNKFLEITIRDETRSGIDTGASGTQADVRRTYFDEYD